MSARLPISVLIPAKNEIAHIAACVASATVVADEIVVVDSGSTDGTRAAAQAAGARVVDFAWNGRFPKKKNWALAHIAWRHPWIFILDADERITPALAVEMRAAFAGGEPAVEGFYINRRFWFLDGWLHHCGYFPSWNLRLFKHALGRYEQPAGGADTASGDNEIHEHVVLRGSVARLHAPMDHFAFPSIDVWIEKHNRYSNWEARLLVAGDAGAANANALAPELARKRRLKALAQRAPLRPTLRFVYHYVLRRGFLDGYRGWVFCRLLAFYEFLSVAKARELRSTSRAKP